MRAFILCSLLAISAANVHAAGDVEITPITPRILFVVAGQEEAAAKVTFLGVVTSAVPELLQHQLDLPEGNGLVVEHVAKDSPAAKAGLERHDILHKLNDQILVNAEQLRTLIRGAKVGDTITLAIIRQAKPMTLKATLGEQTEQPVHRWMGRIQPDQAEGIAREVEESIREHMKKFSDKDSDYRKNIEKLNQELREKIEAYRKAHPGGFPGQDSKFHFGDPSDLRIEIEGQKKNGAAQQKKAEASSSTASATWADGTHTLSMTPTGPENT